MYYQFNAQGFGELFKQLVDSVTIPRHGAICAVKRALMLDKVRQGVDLISPEKR